MERKEHQFQPEAGRAPEKLERYQRIKAEFTRPFTEQEINQSWGQYKNLGQFRKKVDLVHRSLDGYDFAIFLMQEHAGDRIEFQITEANTKYTAENPKPAHLIFLKDLKHPWRWHITHRLINTGRLGISGTEFLQKAEEYMQLAAQHKQIELHSLNAEVSQYTVMEWFLKNGYKLIGNEHLFQEYQSHPEEFEKIYIADNEMGEREEPFLFEKAEINPDEITKYMVSKENGIHLVIPNHQELLRMYGLVRVHLGKTFEEKAS